METEYLKQAEDSPELGPQYFKSRDYAERFMKDFEAKHFKPLIDKFSEQLNSELWSDLEFFLASDTESNIQRKIWSDVEVIVQAILGGEQWAIDRYVMRDTVNCEAVRKSIAAHIPMEIMSQRILDLEKEVRNLKSTLQMYRER